MTEPKWIKVGNTSKLDEKGRMVFRYEGKQILLIQQESQVYAVNNRCPHEGYPLSEGSMSKDCKLTCNWHNWKFDLQTGDTVVGGDALRHYPVHMEEDSLWIDVQDMPQEENRQKALDNIQDSFQRYEYARMARELSRLKQAGGDYQQAVSDCINRNYDHLEYGMGHAFAAASDWLAYAVELEGRNQEDEALVAILEIISHVAWDVLREGYFPFTENILPYDKDALSSAIELEDEETAVSLVRGAISEGLTYHQLEPVLASAALAHYNDFGHSVIYVYKVGQLINQLGPNVTVPLLLSLIRHLVYASREDLIPEFRHYGNALVQWDGKGGKAIKYQDFSGLSVNKTMDRMLQSSAKVDEVFTAIHEKLARNMLYFDLARDQSTDHPIAQNVGWLSFTHGLTFANAVRVLCGRYPDLWPQALLQMACFSGRNVGFIDAEQDILSWNVNNPQAFFESEFVKLVDHSCPEPIVSCHRLKVLAAVREDVGLKPSGEANDVLLASVNRYLNSPLKRKHSLRTAKQARQFVVGEG